MTPRNEETPATTSGAPMGTTSMAEGISSQPQGIMVVPSPNEQVRISMTESMAEFMPLLAKHLVDVLRPMITDQIDKIRLPVRLDEQRTSEALPSTSYQWPASGPHDGISMGLYPPYPYVTEVPSTAYSMPPLHSMPPPPPTAAPHMPSPTLPAAGGPTPSMVRTPQMVMPATPTFIAAPAMPTA